VRQRQVAAVKVMAVCSGGGHWIEMHRIAPALAGLDVVFVSTDAVPPQSELGGARYHRVRNATRRDRLGFAVMTWQIARLVRRERPDVVITTGAAPGLVALAIAKATLGSRTIWIDSIAAGERLSMSGRLARPVADAWLTQWAHLARPGGPEHWGSVL
jgi:UDP-N-acetylglucosamine:LPS N-acetylglucosamine transferase